MTAVARTRAATALLFALSLPPIKSWFGADKVKHFVLSAFVQSASFSAARAAGADRKTSNLAAAGVTVAVGVGREVHDKRVKKQFSVQDLAWDAAGGASMAALLARTR